MFRWLFYNIFIFSVLLPNFKAAELFAPGFAISCSQSRDSIRNATLFENNEILHLSFEGDIKKLMQDRSDDAARHSLVLRYKDSDSLEFTIPIEARTRGNFRRKLGNCRYPPIMLYFLAGSSKDSSIFAGQKKLKLVMPCRDNEYVIKEWLAYQIYNLITPHSFRAKLVDLKLINSRKKEVDQIYAILLEDEDEMAKRNGSFSISRQKLHPSRTDSQAFFKLAMFEYLIGNTDWSVQYMQNIKLIMKDTTSGELPIAVPYDFDMSGWVDAPYAKPAAALYLNSVRTRRFRGYCVNDMAVYTPAIDLFRSVRKDIYTLINSNPYLTPKTIKAEIEYLDAFYKTLDDPQKLKKDLLYPCEKNGTGNVVIRGLQSQMEE